MIRNWKAVSQARFVFTSSRSRRCDKFRIILIPHFGFFSEQRLNINLNSRPEWEQASGWSLSENVTIHIIICHFIIIYVTVFFFFSNSEPHQRLTGFMFVPSAVRGIFFLVHLSLKLSVRVSGSTSSLGKGSRFGFLFFFKIVQAFSLDTILILVYGSLPWFHALSKKKSPPNLGFLFASQSLARH